VSSRSAARDLYDSFLAFIFNGFVFRLPLSRWHWPDRAEIAAALQNLPAHGDLSYGFARRFEPRYFTMEPTLDLGKLVSDFFGV